MPSTCSEDIEWAVSTGKNTKPEWYPDFYKITGVMLTAASETDMQLYWVCTNANPNNNCGGMEVPCWRSCGDDETTTTTTPTTTTTTSADPYSHIGCYKDYESDRAFSHNSGQGYFSIESCYNECASKSWATVFGMEYPEGGECFCGSSLNSATRHGVSSDCYGDGKGGPWSLDVYQINYAPNTNEYVEEEDGDDGKKIFGLDQEVGTVVMSVAAVVCLLCCGFLIFRMSKRKNSDDGYSFDHGAVELDTAKFDDGKGLKGGHETQHIQEIEVDLDI